MSTRPQSPQRQSSRPGPWVPPPVRSLQDTGLHLGILSDLALKTLYFSGYLNGLQIAEQMHLPYRGIVENIMEGLKREKFVEVRGGGGVGTGMYEYALTLRGTEKAHEALARTQYAGPCPVTLNQYIAAMQAQARARLRVHRDLLVRALKGLTISEEMYGRVGPAVNSGKAIFMYGPPGNGKTTIAQSIGRMILGSPMWIPHAIDVDGQVIRVFDNVNHEVLDDDTEDQRQRSTATGVRRDPRWLRIRRPVIMVGGELTMETLDLVYDPINKYYEAPFQMKANGGMFLIDDFGRQQISPTELLNRWIVPLETEIDFMRLNTGQTFQIPFKQLLVFSTNLDPDDLVDGAFLRRIQLKVGVFGPDEKMFYQIFQNQAKTLGFPEVDKETFLYLLNEWYRKTGKPLQSVHPRDLLKAVKVLCEYAEEPLHMTPELIEEACQGYFVKAKDGRIL